MEVSLLPNKNNEKEERKIERERGNKGRATHARRECTCPKRGLELKHVQKRPLAVSNRRRWVCFTLALGPQFLNGDSLLAVVDPIFLSLSVK